MTARINPEQIISFLADNEGVTISTKEMAKEFGSTTKTIYKICNKLFEEKKIHKIGYMVRPGIYEDWRDSTYHTTSLCWGHGWEE